MTMMKPTKIEPTPEITRQIATRRALGASLRELEAEFGYSRPVINRILGSEMAKAIIKGLIDDAVASAVVAVRRRLADMTETAMGVIEHHLKEEKSLEAVKLYFRGLGLDQTEKTAPSQQALQIIMPGASPPTKDVPNDISEG